MFGIDKNTLFEIGINYVFFAFSLKKTLNFHWGRSEQFCAEAKKNRKLLVRRVEPCQRRNNRE